MAEKNSMVRANIKNSEDMYIGLIDEDDTGFRILWNNNFVNYSEYNLLVSNELFQSFEEACQGVYKLSIDAKISETIHFKS